MAIPPRKLSSPRPTLSSVSPRYELTTGGQPDLTEVHLGLNYLHLAQMWRSHGRGFGC
jgi:hypothetical protein